MRSISSSWYCSYDCVSTNSRYVLKLSSSRRNLVINLSWCIQWDVPHSMQARELLEWLDGDVNLAVSIAANTSKVTTYEPQLIVNVASILKDLITPGTYFSNDALDDEGIGVSIEHFLKKIDVLQSHMLGGRPPILESISGTLNRYLKHLERQITSEFNQSSVKQLEILSRGVVELNKFIHSLYNFVGDSRMGTPERRLSLEWYRQSLLTTSQVVDNLCIPYLRVVGGLLHKEYHSSNPPSFLLGCMGNVLVTLILVSYNQPLRRLKIGLYYPIGIVELLLDDSSLPLLCLLFALCCNLDVCAPLPPSPDANPVLLEEYDKKSTQSNKIRHSHELSVKQYLEMLPASLQPQEILRTWQKSFSRCPHHVLQSILSIVHGGFGGKLKSTGSMNNRMTGLSWVHWVPVERTNFTFEVLTSELRQCLQCDKIESDGKISLEDEIDRESKEVETKPEILSTSMKEPHSQGQGRKQSRRTATKQKAKSYEKSRNLPDGHTLASLSVVDLPPPDVRGSYVKSGDPSLVSRSRDQTKYKAREVARKEREMKAKGFNKVSDRSHSSVKERTEEGDAPPEFLCSISKSLMNEPVTRPMDDEVSQQRASAIKELYGIDISDLVDLSSFENPVINDKDGPQNIGDLRNDPATANLQDSPIVTSGGKYRYIWPVYDFSALKSWIRHLNRGTQLHALKSIGECPLTGVGMNVDQVIPANDIRRDITAWHVRKSMCANKDEEKEADNDDLYSF